MQGIRTRDVTALILCGGAGARMGGADKPLLAHRGAPMVQRVLQAMRLHVSEVLISANRNIDTYETLAPVVTDAPRPSQGPLTGVLRAMETTRRDWLWVCPGDAPHLHGELLSRLVEQTPQARVVTAHDGTRDQWLHMLVHISLRTSLTEYLDADGYSVHRWLHSLPNGTHQTVGCPDIASSFLNINEAKDLEGETP